MPDAVVSGYTLDHPLRPQIEAAHHSDHDAESTNLALVIVANALYNDFPTNPDAATQALTGPAAAAGFQGVMEPRVAGAVSHDTQAHEHGETAVQHGRGPGRGESATASAPGGGASDRRVILYPHSGLRDA